MHRVLFAYTSHETSSVVEGYGPMPSACLFEDEHTGRRWLLADAPITLHSWVEAESFGALGMVRTSPLRYVAAEHVAEHREVKAGNVEVPERWWINHAGPLLPSMPLLAAGLIVPKSRFANLHVHSEFCLAPETLVCTSAMEWKKIGDVVEGEELVGFDEDLRPADGQRGNSRSKMQPSTVVATHRRIRDCYRITLEDGTSIISSAQHGWVVTGTTRGSLIEPGGPECGYGMNTRRWLTTERIAERPDRLPRMVRWATPWSDPPPTLQREAAYLAGILDGEGWIHDGQLAVAQNPGAVLDEIKRCCSVLGYPITSDRIQSSKGDCRTFRFAGYETALRVLSQCGPVRFSDRWGEVWVGRRAGGRYTKPVQVVSVEHLGEMETVALTTSTKTFVAEGFLSHNSPLDGLATIEELVDAAVADEQEFISVTDHGYCAAHPQLAKIAKAAGIKPIFGIEANLVNNRFERETETVLRPDGSARQRAHYWHFIMLAMNDVGLRNLWAASSEAHITGFWGRPRMDWSTLEKHNEGIIASTACLRGPVSSLILSGDIEGAAMLLARLRSIFPDRLYVELHANHLPDQLIVNRALVELAASLSLPTIVVADSHYACRDEQDLHQVWIAVQTDKDLDDDQELFAGGQHYHVHSTADIEHSLDYLPRAVVEEAMRNTIEIGTMCTAEIRPRSAMPVFHRHDVKGTSIGSGVERDVEVLRQKVEEGFAAKVAHKENVSVYRDQVERELDLMVSKGFAGYFLIVDDYCEAARSGRAHPQGKKILMGPGRGSVVGSLVAYLLGITKIDPIEADLMFERFLTPGRTSPPDIDLDFPSSERDSITGYTINRWGEDRVVRVGTHGRLKNKGVIQKVAKALGSRITVDFMDLKEISRIITAAEAHTAGAGLKWDELWEQEGDLLEPYRQKYPEIFEVSDKLVKRLASYGRHASGIVIDPEESIVDRLPLRTAGSEKEGRQIVTEFDFEWLEFLGFLKFDFLTLRTLDTIQQCVDLIADDRALPGISIDIDSWVDEYEDPQVWDMLCEGDTLGVFQIETSEGSKLVRRMQPRSIADLSAILTLVRPGPMRSGLTDSYLRRRFGQEEIVATLPEMEAVLGRTYQCFAAETEVITRNGTRRIKDLHQSLGEQVMDGNGRWVDADVRWFGQQSLVKISLKRNKQTKDIFATADHRWFARWSDSKSKFVECTTDDLRPGMILRSGMPNGAQNTNLSPVGACAGIVFGDGVCTPHSTYVDLWGDKNIDLLHLFGEQRRASVESDPRCALPKVRVFDMPRSWKSHPSLDEGASFLLGWMAGYFAADGCVSKTGQAVLSSARREDLEWFRTVANVVGIGTYGITKSVTDKAPPGQPLRTATLYQVGLVASSIPDGFFLISEHADRFAASRASRVRADRTQWTVGSVEATERIEDVYCAVIPTTASFVLEDHILTGNCMIYQEDIMGVCQALAGYDLAEADKVRAILGKKKVEEAKKEGRRFIERCKERGLDEATVEHIWSQMEEFAKYCVTGDTKIMLAGAGQNSDGWMDVEDAYRRLHVDPPSPWRAKFRARKKGVFGMAVHPDGRIRKCRILDVQPAGMQRVVKIVLENGMSITATPDHRHLTPEGLRYVDDGLAVGDMLIVNGGYERDSYTPERDRTTVGERVSEGAINSAFGDDNYGYINGGFASLSAWTAQTPKVCAECGHDGSERRIERAHLDGDRQNNEWSNLRMLCSSCHKKFDYEHNGRRRRGEKGLLSSESRIVSISDEGVQMTYDVMMDEPHVWIANGIATTNTFNRAHAWSYAVLAYWCAWLKCHFPAHFLVAVLSTVDKARIPEFVELARRNGYSVSAPDVNDSQIGFSVSSDRLGVRYGFSSIPDIGTAAANAIIESQPYSSWDDFVSRRGPACNWGHIKKLAAVGTFDSILPVGQHRAALERLIEQMAEGKAITCVHKRPGYEGPNGLPCAFPWETEVTIGKSGKPLKQRPLPKTCSRACRQYHEQETYTWPRVDPLSEREVRERERAALGVYLSSTPFDIVSTEYLDAESILYGFEAESAPAGNHVVFGMVQSIRKHVDRSGNQMAFLRVNSRGYELDLTCFSKTWFQIEHLVSRDVLALFEINRNARGSTLSNFYPIPV